MVFYSRFLKPSRNYLRGFLIAALAGDKIAEFSFPEILFHFPLRPCFFFVSPAYAGKSLMTRLFSNRNWDHPRICGEKLLLSPVSRARSGSPPRMRGKVKGIKLFLRCAGITPAYAGKSRRFVIYIHNLGDHPRVCGEKGSRLTKVPFWSGSPPRMRGKAPSALYPENATGITPAHAGKR